MISANFVPEDIAIGHWRDWAAERGARPAARAAQVPRRPHAPGLRHRRGGADLPHPGCALGWYFKYIIGLTGHGGFVGMLKHDPEMPDCEVTPDYCIENIVIAGSPRTVAEKLAAFREKTGPSRR